MASLSEKPKVILSSGSRIDIGMEEDVGVMAFRNPSDLENILQVVMKFDGKMSYEALHTAGTFVLEQAHLRRFGKASITVTGMSISRDNLLKEEERKDRCQSVTAAKNEQQSAEGNENMESQIEEYPSAGDLNGDGFIAF